MFEKFTERARKVIAYGKAEAERLHHDALDTEHLLLGMIKEGTGMGIRILLKMDIDPANIQRHIEKHIFKGTQLGYRKHEIPFTDLAKKVLATAIYESKNMGHNYVGTEHLLLALIREGEGRAGKVLRDFRVEFSTAKKIVYELLGSTPAKGAKEYSKTPVLDSFGRDLTEYASAGKLDPIIGREDEIERMIQILCRRTKNNPVLIGEPGVGKTAIVEGLAQNIVSAEIPEILNSKRIVTLDLAALVAGTKYRGQFEERLQTVIKELQKSDEVIIFIDEIHTLVGAGAAEGSIDASNMLKPALSRGEIQCIGATTMDEYRKHIEKDGALERRFQTIKVDEPSLDETIEIIRGLKHKYEDHHKSHYTEEAIVHAVNLAEQYITDRNLPDKAIDVIDEAGSRVRLEAMKLPLNLKNYEEELRRYESLINDALKSNNFNEVTKLRERKNRLQFDFERMKGKWRETQFTKEVLVTKEDVAYVVSKWAGVPLRRLEEEETARLLEMEENLHNRIVGQDEAITAVSKAIRRARTGLKEIKKPIGSFLFLGPTGVGKTELGRTLAEFMFGDEKAIIRIDMSEFMEKHSVSRLVGSPPGYVGYGEGGQLTEQVRRKPYSVILLDEIEKANTDVFNILLQVMEDGHLTDSMGRLVNFKNTIIIMTSNIGARLIRRNTSMGFGVQTGALDYKKMKETIMSEVKRTFNPEFLNRLDELIVFHALNREHIRDIIDLQIRRLNRQVEHLGLEIEVTKEAKEWLLKKGFEPELGARPIKRTIKNYIEDPLAEERLKGRFIQSGLIVVELDEDDLVFKEPKPEDTVLSSPGTGASDNFL